VLAVAAAAIADVVVFTQMGAWVGIGAVLAAVYLLFAAFGAGWFAMDRSALAGALSVPVGAEAAGVLVYFTAPPLEVAGASALDLLGWAVRVLISVLPYAVGGAFAGAAGGWLRRRALTRIR
jgi:hypothetical protein